MMVASSDMGIRPRGSHSEGSEIAGVLALYMLRGQS